MSFLRAMYDFEQVRYSDPASLGSDIMVVARTKLEETLQHLTENGVNT